MAMLPNSGILIYALFSRHFRGIFRRVSKQFVENLMTCWHLMKYGLQKKYNGL